jgi:hypothetical protein
MRCWFAMADGREPSLRSQAIPAALIHEQAGAAPSEEKLNTAVATLARWHSVPGATRMKNLESYCRMPARFEA